MRTATHPEALVEPNAPTAWIVRHKAAASVGYAMPCNGTPSQFAVRPLPAGAVRHKIMTVGGIARHDLNDVGRTVAVCHMCISPSGNEVAAVEGTERERAPDEARRRAVEVRSKEAWPVDCGHGIGPAVAAHGNDLGPVMMTRGDRRVRELAQRRDRFGQWERTTRGRLGWIEHEVQGLIDEAFHIQTGDARAQSRDAMRLTGRKGRPVDALP